MIFPQENLLKIKIIKMIFLFRFEHRTERKWGDSVAIFSSFSRSYHMLINTMAMFPINFNYATVLMSLNGL
jgi:hypothetical protein